MMPQVTVPGPFRHNALSGANGVHHQAAGFDPSQLGPSPVNKNSSPSPAGLLDTNEQQKRSVDPVSLARPRHLLPGIP